MSSYEKEKENGTDDDAESGVMPLQVEEHKGLLATAEAKKQKQKQSHGIDSSPRAFGESRALSMP